MTKPRDILKGKVKRLLREQDDMGQLGDGAVEHCVMALEAFLRDMGRRLTAEAQKTDAAVVTPVEFKRCVLTSADLEFLHDKVQAIDESDAKYQRSNRQRKRKVPTDGAEKSETPKPKKTTSAKASAAKKTTKQVQQTEGSSVVASTAAALSTARQAPEIEEDDNYDSSDSE